MLTATKSFLACFLGILLFAGSSILVFGASPAQTLNLPDAGANNAVDDDDVPDVTARVARISFIRGEVKIRRAGSTDWENAGLNLPLVEGDEIVTNDGARVEIQFDKNSHVRLAEDSCVKIVTLKDEGVALSVSLGTLSVRVTSFDTDRSYFEIDAPKTTLALQVSGTYRVDAGKEGDKEVRIAATDGGEARVYSDNAGFTLKNGRSSRIFIDGVTAGEWELSDASAHLDEFDGWATDRDSTIAKRLNDAYYDKYYDSDIYGADDLNDYGSWIYTRSYGYVWRPSGASLSGYADWSPYRYGQWRWMPPYGWIWVNDEPWGWATYHHGRWVFEDGFWDWSPYGYYRTSRSWWEPALVVISVVANNICWYPEPYHHHHNDFNWEYHHHGNPGGEPPPNGGGGRIKPFATASPKTPPGIVPHGNMTGDPRYGGAGAPVGQVPVTGVVTIGTGEFGTKTGGVRTATPIIAQTVLTRDPGDGKTTILPAYTEIKGKIGREIISDRPRADVVTRQTQVGAAVRKTDEPLDKELRATRVYGGRAPLTKTDDTGGVKTTGGDPAERRKTGAVERQTGKQTGGETTVKQSPGYVPGINGQGDPKTPKPQFPSTGTPKQATPRTDPPPTRTPPPPPHNDPPPVKVSPPAKETPPAKSEPKSDTTKKGKDGR